MTTMTTTTTTTPADPGRAAGLYALARNVGGLVLDLAGEFRGNDEWQRTLPGRVGQLHHALAHGEPEAVAAWLRRLADDLTGLATSNHQGRAKELAALACTARTAADALDQQAKAERLVADARRQLAGPAKCGNCGAELCDCPSCGAAGACLNCEVCADERCRYWPAYRAIGELEAWTAAMLRAAPVHGSGWADEQAFIISGSAKRVARELRGLVAHLDRVGRLHDAARQLQALTGQPCDPADLIDDLAQSPTRPADRVVG